VIGQFPHVLDEFVGDDDGNSLIGYVVLTLEPIITIGVPSPWNSTCPLGIFVIYTYISDMLISENELSLAENV
jgi:hypothetical protein